MIRSSASVVNSQPVQHKALIVRDAVANDLPAIVDIYNSTIPSRKITGDTEPVSVESRRAWFDAHSPNQYPIWVAERDGAIAGWLSLQPFYGRPAYRATAEFSIYVASGCRRQGIGQTLLTQAIAYCPALHITTLLGFVFAQNEPSLKLLQRFGFTQWGFLPNVAQFDVGSCDLVILGLKVGDAK